MSEKLEDYLKEVLPQYAQFNEDTWKWEIPFHELCKMMQLYLDKIKTYEEGYHDGFMKGTEKARKTVEELAEGVCNPIIYEVPESGAIKILQEQIQKLKADMNANVKAK